MNLSGYSQKAAFFHCISACSLIFFLSCQKGGSQTAEWVKFKDLKTGVGVWQVTSHDSLSEAFYFYAPSFTADDKYLIFRSTRSGVMEIYRCDLSNGAITRLTDQNVSSACIHPDGESMVYIADWSYYKMNVHTLEKEVIIDFKDKIPEKPVFRPTLTNDGKFTLVYTNGNNKICLYRVNLETKEVLKVFEQQGGRFSHQLINPSDPDIITYTPLPDRQDDMNLPMPERARTRMINVKEGTDKPFLVTPYGFRATHDSWSHSGDKYFFFEKSVPGWIPASIGSVSADGELYTKHFTSDSIKLGHGTVSKNGRWFISDSQDPFKNPLILINLEDGTSKIIAWPDASIKKDLGNVHVHPNFSLSGNYVVYTSDFTKTGTHQVYVVPIKEIIKNWITEER